MDKLQQMLDKQKVLQDRLRTMNFQTPLERTEFIKAHAQYADQELHELLRELEGFKPWKNYNWSDDEKLIRLALAREEFIDAFHFMLNIALALDLDADALFQIYCSKNNINHARQDENY